MLSSLLIRLVVVIVFAAIGRGIVLAFGLDVKVARAIQVAAKSGSFVAVSWVIAGMIGLVGLLGWELFHVSDRLGRLFLGIGLS